VNKDISGWWKMENKKTGGSEKRNQTRVGGNYQQNCKKNLWVCQPEAGVGGGGEG